MGSELDGRLGAAVAEHLTRLEVQALWERADVLLATETFPAPNGTGQRSRGRRLETCSQGRNFSHKTVGTD